MSVSYTAVTVTVLVQSEQLVLVNQFTKLLNLWHKRNILPFKQMWKYELELS